MFIPEHTYTRTGEEPVHDVRMTMTDSGMLGLAQVATVTYLEACYERSRPTPRKWKVLVYNGGPDHKWIKATIRGTACDVASWLDDEGLAGKPFARGYGGELMLSNNPVAANQWRRRFGKKKPTPAKRPRRRKLVAI